MLATFLVSTYLFWLLYMVFASFHTARRAGLKISWFSYALFLPVLLVGYPLDVLWNTVFGSLFYLEAPWAESWKPWTWTFTGRCIRWKNDSGWRGKQSMWWASVLNPFDKGHV
jgi:hypothetical protein